MRDIHFEQNKIRILDIDGDVNIMLENIWSDKGYLNIKNQSKKRTLYLKNVNIPQNIDKAFGGKIITN